MTGVQTCALPIFKNAKMLEEAKEAYLQEAEAHTNNKTYPTDNPDPCL